MTAVGGEASTSGHLDTLAMNEVALTLGRPAGWAEVRRYLDEVAAIVAATGRLRAGGSSSGMLGRAWFQDLDQFKADHPQPREDAQAARDWETLNSLAVELSDADWRLQKVEHVAEAVAASGRPHPGGSLHGRAYEAALARWSGEATGLPSGVLVIRVDDLDLPDNAVEPWTATATWEVDAGFSDTVGVGGGSTISGALRDLASDLEEKGALDASLGRTT